MIYMNLSQVNTQFVSSDFKVDLTTGIGYVSQYKAAELCGVSQQAISLFCLSRKIDTYQHLTDESLVLLVTHYALDSKKANATAKKTLKAFARAGARAFIYSQVNYNPVVPKPDRLHEPCVPVRWLAQQIGRSRASVNRTLNASILRLRAFKVSEEIQFVNGERCVSPALILCSAFTGKNMQAARGLLLELTETDALPPTDVLLKLATLPTN